MACKEKNLNENSSNITEHDIQKLSANERNTFEDELCKEYTCAVIDSPSDVFLYRSFDDRTVHNEELDWKVGRPSFYKSTLRCLFFAFSTTIIFGIPLGVYTATLAWLDLRLAEACYSKAWKGLPVSIKRVRLTAQVVEGVFIQFWSFSALLFMFGIKQLKDLNIPVWNVLAASFDAIYRLFLHTYGVYHHSWTSYPLNVLFVAITTFNFYRITLLFSRDIKPRVILAAKLGMGFIFGTPLFILMNYLLFPVYARVPSDTTKAVFSVFLPVVFILPKAVINVCLVDVSDYCSTRYSSILVVGFHTIVIIIARFLQANIEEIKIFTIICVVHGLESLFDKLTLNLRLKAYRKLCKSCAGIQDGKAQEKKRQSAMNRLLAEQSISGMILETDTILFSCALVAILTFYYGNGNNKWNDMVTPFVERVSIAASIELIFNLLCTKVLTYYYNIPVIRVWRKRWWWIIAGMCTYTAYATLYCTEYLYQPIVSHGLYNRSKLAACPNTTIAM
ncbi:uncharacterized protein LOC135686732 [Rhopilema esculentum]|uniref:uncharacterized protein LOC135686732 n=1 Tax=Rhopilema esculentum TaxID=499914 RepID=UPI0031DD43DE|eukprot:gene62-9671_t